MLSYSPPADVLGVRQFLERIPEVVNWHYYTPYTFLVATSLLAKDLSTRFHAAFPEARHFVLEVHPQAARWGFMPPQSWDLMAAPGPPQPEPPPPPPPPPQGNWKVGQKPPNPVLPWGNPGSGS
jgi:hypothetical protein